MNYNYQNLNEFKLPKKTPGKHRLTLLLWGLIQKSIFSYSPQFMYFWRVFLLRSFGATIGKKVIIRPSVKIIYPWKLSIGDNSWIGDDVTLYTIGKISIGYDTVISQKSYLCTGSHDYKSSNFETFSNDITIGNKVWIATDVYIAPGVTIENGAIVAARSSVFKNLPKDMICMGSPAKPIKSRFNTSTNIDSINDDIN